MDIDAKISLSEGEDLQAPAVSLSVTGKVTSLSARRKVSDRSGLDNDNRPPNLQYRKKIEAGMEVDDKFAAIFNC